jgi:hypothetical protein
MQLLGMHAIPSFVGFKSAGKPNQQINFRTRNAQARQIVAVRASVIAEPAAVDVKNLDGTGAGTASLALRVAEPDVAKGLVHRYLVMVRQNARRVSESPSLRDGLVLFRGMT